MNRINGTKGNDLLYGTAADDEVLLGLGDDTVYAGDGNDAIYARDTSMLSSDNDGNDMAYGEGGNDNLIGGTGNDRLDGGAGNDTLDGGDGNDSIDGGTGTDRILTGDGRDVVHGGAGDDEINGYLASAHNPYFWTYSGQKQLYGDDGNDIIIGGTDADTIWGGVGNDDISGIGGNDSILGESGNDYINGDDGNDTLTGGDGNDTLYGGNGNDTLDGGDGNDFLYSGAGDDTVHGGAGDDEINGSLSANGGYSFFASSGSQQLHGDDGNDVIIGGTGPDQIGGGNGSDYLNGRDGDDSLAGGLGDDSLYGGNGNDTLDGGTGNDTLSGGDGNDYYVVGSTTAYVTDSGGTDTALVTVNFVKIPSDIESVTFATGIQALPYWIDALLPDSAAGLHDKALLGPAKTFSFAFPSAIPSYDTSADNANGFQPFNEQQKSFARQAFSYISSVVDLAFTETTVTSAANTVTLANNTQDSQTAGYAFNPTETFAGSDVFLNRTDVDNISPADGNPAALTLIHELGHALGLKHPFSLATLATDVAEPPYLAGIEDNTLWTVMSYTDDRAQYHLAYSPLDIAALQYLYGPSSTARSGNDVYKVDQSAANFVWDGAGKDTLDASNQTQPVTLYLEPGYWGYVGSKASTITSAGQVTVNFGSVIETLVGGSASDSLFGNDTGNSISGGTGHDTISGNAGNDTLDGGSGNDMLDGGVGVDTALYAGSRTGYALTATGTMTTVLSRTGTEGTDTLTGIERLQFSDKKLAIDLGVTESAGETALLIGAVLGKASLADNTLVGSLLIYFDSGATMRDAATTLVNGGVMDAFAGGPSTGAFVRLIYKAVIGQTPTATDAKDLATMIDDGTFTKVSFLTFVAESSLNQANVGLVGLQQTGIEYS